VDANRTTRIHLGTTPLQYLRFDAGKYGLAKLQALTRLQTGPRADRIRQLAQEELARKERWGMQPASGIAEAVAGLKIFPAGRTLDRELTDELVADLHNPVHGFAYARFDDDAAGVFIDLNGDKIDEFVFLGSHRGLVYEMRAGHWVFASDLLRQGGPGKLDVIGELTKANLSADAPKWSDLVLGGYRFRVND
jgi:hypothetical protein